MGYNTYSHWPYDTCSSHLNYETNALYETKSVISECTEPLLDGHLGRDCFIFDWLRREKKKETIIYRYVVT